MKKEEGITDVRAVNLLQMVTEATVTLEDFGTEVVDRMWSDMHAEKF
jgi:hypothetical protein